MDFVLLQKRLLAEIRARVRNGEMTERSLARATGMSQPHIHNVLKGTRSLSLGSSDRLLRRLGLDLADLLAGTRAPCEPSQNDCRLVPVLDGPIGQGFPFPAAVGRHLYPFSAADVDTLPDPVAARLAPAAHSAPLFSGNAVILLDRSATAGRDSNGEEYVALDLGGTSAIGLASAEGVRVWNAQGVWERVDLRGRPAGEMVRARVRLIVRCL
ncbi:MAG TPA: helix-turn-helix domain-containing protein [Bryobacteraceae bacterium]|nr:helix-turn-helix domain-containing protein [Bryobacteraceae bacterium]